MEYLKRTWADVSLDHLRHNYEQLRARMPSGCRFLGVVKADAYGHGAVPVSRYLTELGAEYLAVSNIEEAVQLRQGGIRGPILILGYTPAVYADRLARLGLRQEIHSLEYARQLNEQLKGSNRRIRIHLKLDTGMSRLGFFAYNCERTVDELKEISQMDHLIIEGVFTHFCVSDGEEDVRPFTHVQFARFKGAYEAIEAAWGRKFSIHHCTNSGAMHAFPETYMDMVRPGVSLYGMYPGPVRENISLVPAMTLKTRVAYVEEHEPGDTISYGRTFTVEKPSKLAVLPIGYADGLHRVLSGKLRVRINGHIVPQVGRICMDMCMADITGVDDIKRGDVVTLIGGDSISWEEAAQKVGTICHELTCCVTARAKRIYVNGDK